jgi:hypothetical protein
MKLFPFVTTFLLVTTGCSQPAELPPQQRTSAFFVGVDIAKLPEPARSAVVAAEKDIELVLRGLPPACKSEPETAFSDGGTSVYKCKYYDLTVMSSIYQVGDVYGTMYGPIVTFPDDYSISYVRFYRNEELRALKKR